MTERLDAKDVRRTVAMLHRTTGVPVTYGGLVDDGKVLQLSELVGTTGRSLCGLTIYAGRGLGGRTMVLRRPVAVSDYQKAAMISHDYDRPVRDEGVRSAIAVPVVVRKVVRAVLYGARREPVQLGDHTVQAAIAAARDLEQELVVRDEVDRRVALFQQGPGTSTASRLTSDPTALEAIRQAHAELRIMAAQTDSQEIQRRIEQVCATLWSAFGMHTPFRHVLLAPRELDVLSCVALGQTNAEIANEFGLEAETVKSYLRSAMRKLDVSTRMQAVVAARRAGLMP